MGGGKESDLTPVARPPPVVEKKEKHDGTAHYLNLLELGQWSGASCVGADVVARNLNASVATPRKPNGVEIVVDKAACASDGMVVGTGENIRRHADAEQSAHQISPRGRKKDRRGTRMRMIK